MNLTHYSPKPIEKLDPYPREKWGSRYSSTSPNDHPVGDKPFGFWISDDSQEPNWKSWCEGEEWGLERLKYPYLVELKQDSNILILRGIEAVMDFHNKYKSPLLPDYIMIDWKRVSSDYQGIIISPYIWEFRLNQQVPWYYGWDCASGCIWDIEAIATIAPKE